MHDLFQISVSGLALGSAYALVAVGFALTIKATGVINFAQPEVVMIGAMVGHTAAVGWSLPYVLALGVVAVAGAAIGAALYLLVLGPMIRRGATTVAMILATVAVGLFLREAAVRIWGTDPRSYGDVVPQWDFSIGDVSLGAESVVVVIGCVVILAIVAAVLRWTHLGIAARAVAVDREIARTMGVRATRADMGSLAASCAFAAVAGGLLAPSLFARPDLGVIGVKAFAGAAVGGLASLPGAAIGGLFVGQLETLGGFYVSTAFKSGLAFVLVIVVLLIRPQGMLTRRQRTV